MQSESDKRITTIIDMVKNLKEGDLVTLSDFFSNLEELCEVIPKDQKIIITEIIEGGIEKFSKDLVLNKLNSIIKGEPDFYAEIMDLFVVESKERIIVATDSILEIENGDYSNETINNLFRVFHTLKGECGFLKLNELGILTHSLEALLEKLRNNEIIPDKKFIDCIFSGIDKIKEFLDSIILKDYAKYKSVSIQSVVKDIDSLLDAPAEMKINSQNLKAEKKRDKGSESEEDSVVKVKSSLINNLVNMIGELLIAENQMLGEDILHDQDSYEDIQYMKNLTKSIQHIAIMLRTIKINNLLTNMKRVVRDVSNQLNKDVEFLIEGESLEVDRILIEKIEEPLIHILRNSLSHGIELKEERIKKDKKEKGTIKLKASRDGSQIVLSIRDDGKGIDKEKVLNKAIELGLIKEENIERLNDSEILSFIYHPGFSTADIVDSISGRGVGMDVVKTVVDELRGKIIVKSEKDKFTEVILQFPLIMAIIEGLIVKLADTSYIIPISKITETFKFDRTKVHYIKNNPFIILRGESIPVIYLREFFDIKDSKTNDIELAVIVTYNKRSFAFIVDEIEAQKEVVIKALGSKLRNMKGVFAGTILSGGKIGLIINIEQIIS